MARERESRRRRERSNSYSSAGSGRGDSEEDREERRRQRQRRHRHEDRKKHRKEKRRHRRDDSDSEEEERARRKQRKKADKMLASFGYSNETNPFGDSNLSQPFVWSKKYEGKSGGKTQAPSDKELKKQQLRRVDEIQKARQRREAREAEKEEMERLKSEELRLRDAEQYEDWQQKEEEFHLAQTRVRSKLRIQNKREKPVDLLAKNLLLVSARSGEEDEDKEAFFRREIKNVRVEHRQPYAIVEVLSMDELEELRDEIGTYQELEGDQGQNAEFWKLMALICRDRIRRLRHSQTDTHGAIHDSVNDTITDMLHGKDKAELRKLKAEVEQTIASAEHTTGVDVEFWEEVGQQIEVYEARARLTELHEVMLDKLADLMNEHEQRAFEAEVERSEATSNVGKDGRDESREAREMERSFTDKDGEEGASEDRLDAADEVSLDVHGLPEWSDKYQPRKPRYFNRVKTGYDWNKYNQTHYDHDNPPPKVVQGYKFNLFYPDLLDKSTAPRFTLEKANSSEFCIIRFSAGPPYQDIAFKIVNREWEYSHKRGFKSVFERGILHLYFNFKRHRYRR